ncbi:MAG: class II glutamine amidotransferase [Pseudomonadota bacterium]
MCRLAAYVGGALPLSTLLFDRAHGLSEQAYAPRELVRGNVNVDGTGIAWWDATHAEPLVYVTSAPPWGDVNLERIMPKLTSTTHIAAVRSATPGLAFGPDHVSPFVHNRLAGAHNGWIEGFRGAIGQSLIGSLPGDVFSSMSVMNDSQTLFLLAAMKYEETASLEQSLRHALRTVRNACRDHNASAALNLVLGDRAAIIGCRFSVGAEQNSLYTSVQDAGRFLASEPLDDHTWERVPESHFALVSRDGISVAPIDL